MEFRGYLETSADIVARISQLEETLAWEPGPVSTIDVPGVGSWSGSEEVRLVSKQSERIIAYVKSLPDGTWQVFYDKWGGANSKGGQIFRSKDGALRYVKFSALKDILEDDLRRTTIQ